MHVQSMNSTGTILIEKHHHHRHHYHNHCHHHHHHNRHHHLHHNHHYHHHRQPTVPSTTIIITINLLFLPPSTYCSFHFQTSSRNFSLPKSCLESPRSFTSFFSTTTWVAIPAWSQPGTHVTPRPFILCLRLINYF